MKVEKNIIGDAKMELTVTVETADLHKYLPLSAERLSREIKVPGWRPGRASLEVMKARVGEMALWEEAARLWLAKKLDGLLAEECPRPIIGEPRLDIKKLAPGNDLEFKVTVGLLPEVILGEYKNLGLAIESVKENQEEIDRLTEQLRESRVREAAADRPVAANDKVVVDIKMFLDKVPVDGGQSQDVAVIMGKDYIIPGFDEKLMGADKNETRDFVLNYPATHWQKHLAGKKVEFSVIIKEIYERQLPDLTDDFARAFGAKNQDDLKDSLRKNWLDQKHREAHDQARVAMLDRLVAQAKIGELPAELVSSELAMMLAEMEHRVTGYGGRFEDYLLSIKKTREDLKIDWQEEAVKRVKIALILRSVAEAEKIVASPAEIDRELEHVKSHYQGDAQALAVIESVDYRRRVVSELVNQKTLRSLSEWNIREDD